LYIYGIIGVSLLNCPYEKKQFQPLSIMEFKEKTFHLPIHGQNYYELVYIISGKGYHILNKDSFTYSSGDLFTICPQDEHYFDVESETEFLFISFTDGYFQGSIPYQFKLPVEDLLESRILKEIKLQFDKDRREILSYIIKGIRRYIRIDIPRLEISSFIYSQIVAILTLIIEHLATMDISLSAQQSPKEELTTYVHENIYYPQQLQIKQIAAHFNLSAGYFGDYFKKNMGMAYIEYLNSYKLELIKMRLLNPKLTIKVIVNEFSFIDQSHLYHFFKKWNHEERGFANLLRFVFFKRK